MTDQGSQALNATEDKLHAAWARVPIRRGMPRLSFAESIADPLVLKILQIQVGLQRKRRRDTWAS